MDGRIRLATKEDALDIHNLHTRSVRGVKVPAGWLDGSQAETKRMTVRLGTTGVMKTLKS